MDFNLIALSGYYRALETVKIIEKSNIGNIPIMAVSSSMLQKFLGSLTHYANATIKKVYRQLIMAFNIAFESGMIAKNPMNSRQIVCPKSDKPDKKVKAYTLEEQKFIEEATLAHKVPYGRVNYKHQIFIELYSGLRMGEINALRPEDLDFDAKLIHVRRTISKGKSNEIIVGDTTKTYAGLRDVPMNSVTEEHLQQALREMKGNPDGLIFYDHRKKKPLDSCQTNLFFRRLCEKEGIPFYGQHALRHTFATRCVEADVKPVVLKKWMGHTDIHITMDIYTEVFDSMNNKSIDLLEKYIAGENENVDDNESSEVICG